MTVSATNSEAQRESIAEISKKRSMRHMTRNQRTKIVVRDFVNAPQAIRRRAPPKIPSTRRGFFDFISDAVDKVRVHLSAN